MPVDQWNAATFKAKVRAGVADAFEAVGPAIATVAKSRVPRSKGAGGASGGGHAADTITYTVTISTNAVTLRVGAGPGAFYLGFFEKGTSKMAARPWLWPSILESKTALMAAINGGINVRG